MRLGLPLRRCMEEHTQLERDVVLRWMDDHFSEKDLTHWYLQRVAFEVRCTNPAYRGKRVSLDDLHVSLKAPAPASPPDKQAASRASQAKWFALTGFKRR